MQVTGDGTAINNLYGRFCQDGSHNKPMVITETSAFWLPSITIGVSDLQLKSTWWQQAWPLICRMRSHQACCLALLSSNVLAEHLACIHKAMF